MNLNLSIKELNELLSQNKKYFVEKILGHQGIDDDEEGTSGEYNEYHEIYKSPNMPENLYFKVTYRTDSYGYDALIANQKFVNKIEKTINTYE